MYETKIIADSVGPNGVRVTTLTVVTWKPLIGEFNTHRVLTRNSVSSRAKSFKRQVVSIMEKPHIPVFQKNTKEMQPGEYFTPEQQEYLGKRWLAWRDANIQFAEEFADFVGGVHKQWINRPLEPWMETEVLVTATEWDNFLNLRVYGGAQTEMRETVRAIQQALLSCLPDPVKPGTWHMPFINDRVIEYVSRYTDEFSHDERPNDVSILDYILGMISAGRAATVSYDNLGQGVDIMKDFNRARGLLKAGHMSPFEHQAKIVECTDTREISLIGGTYDEQEFNTAEEYSGNLRGVVQFRKCFPGEAVWLPAVPEA